MKNLPAKKARHDAIQPIESPPCDHLDWPPDSRLHLYLCRLLRRVSSEPHSLALLLLKFSATTNISNFATQVEAFKLLPAWGVQFVANTLPFTEIILGLLLLIGWRLRIWAPLLTLIMLGFFGVVLRAYLLHMDINCGCFLDSPTDQSSKGAGRCGALWTCAAHDYLHFYRSSPATSVGGPGNDARPGLVEVTPEKFARRRKR